MRRSPPAMDVAEAISPTRPVHGRVYLSGHGRGIIYGDQVGRGGH